MDTDSRVGLVAVVASAGSLEAGRGHDHPGPVAPAGRSPVPGPAGGRLGRGLPHECGLAGDASADTSADPDDRQFLTAATGCAVRDEEVLELEHRVRRADGTLGWRLSRAVPVLDDDGQIVEWAGVGLDTTAARPLVRPARARRRRRPPAR